MPTVATRLRALYRKITRRPALDTWSSASRQHFIDTGHYLPVGWDD